MLHEERCKARSSATAKGVVDDEPLQALALLSELVDPLLHLGNQLPANGVLTPGVIVGGILLACDELIGVEEVAIVSSANFVYIYKSMLGQKGEVRFGYTYQSLLVLSQHTQLVAHASRSQTHRKRCRKPRLCLPVVFHHQEVFHVPDTRAPSRRCLSGLQPVPHGLKCTPSEQKKSISHAITIL